MKSSFPSITRRRFLGTSALVAAGMTAASNKAAALSVSGMAGTPPRYPAIDGSCPLRAFDYRGVCLMDSPFQQQMLAARDMYSNMSLDDMLRGFRKAAHQPAPGEPMKGWASHSTQSTFGQWMSGLARMSCALNDSTVRNKAIAMTTGWERTIGADGNPRLKNPYCYEKMCCGLVDMAIYADYPHALEILDRITSWANKDFDRTRLTPSREDRSGRGPGNTNEWYTLPENLFRAYKISGNKAFLDFANVWLYPAFWDRFENCTHPSDGVAYLHAYSHINCLNGAAMAYLVTKDPRYLKITENAYRWIRDTQAYASGGYGPGEWTVPADGSLGDALTTRIDMAEIPCGSWAGLKLSRFLTGATGKAEYGDWTETLFYNAIGAALPTEADGSTFYYANYHVGMGLKEYGWSNWSCCSGTYIQDVADYHNIIYYHDNDGLYVNLAVPSTVDWDVAGSRVHAVQETTYPEADSTTLRIEVAKPTRFKIHFRIPSWCSNATLAVNGKANSGVCTPNHWATIDSMWNHGDKVTATFPMSARAVPVDVQHPERIAVMYGPLLMVQNAAYTFPIRGPMDEVVCKLYRAPNELELQFNTREAARDNPTGVKTDIATAAGQQVGGFYPFYTVNINRPYRSYFDMDRKTFF